MKKIFLTLLLPLLLVLSGCNTQAAMGQNKNSSGVKDLEISLLNIGHGDSILIQTPEQTILIDTADASEHAKLVNELEKFSVTKIDKLILTHPHVDHIGGARMLIAPTEKHLAEFPYLKKISVAEVYDNGIPFTSAAYRNYLGAVESTGVKRQSLKVGDTLNFGGGVKFKVLWPPKNFVDEMNAGKADKDDKDYKMNNSSIVGRLTYGNFSMMFTGDCEKETENKIVENNDAKDLKCNVLKAGHHGSRTSSTVKFLRAVDPEYILISAGNKEDKGNAHGSPHLRPLEKYLAQGVDPKKIFCTRWNGSITVTTDGKTFSVTPETQADWVEEWMEKKRKLNVT